jgi:hypothetical protein
VGAGIGGTSDIKVLGLIDGAGTGDGCMASGEAVMVGLVMAKTGHAMTERAAASSIFLTEISFEQVVWPGPLVWGETIVRATSQETCNEAASKESGGLLGGNSWSFT